MKLPCKMGSRCPDFNPAADHEHNHNDTRCTQIGGGIGCPGDGKCVEWHDGACAAGEALRRFKRETRSER